MEDVWTWGSWTRDEDPETRAGLPLNIGEGRQVKALMGWNGIGLLDDSVNVVDMCREFVTRAHAESCGQCFPCRLGFTEMRRLLERLCTGEGTAEDIDRLQTLAEMVRSSSKCDIGRTSPRPLLDALKTRREDFLAAAGSSQRIARGNYTGQLTAPCIQACPSHVDVPGYVEQIRFGRPDKALDTVLRDCALPGVAGRVCVRLCEFNCRRASYDEPLAIRSLKRYAADWERPRGALHESTPKTFKREKVAIIGAGPAGLACVYYLAQQGYRSTVFDVLEEPGGMVAVGIPDYRLPRHIVREEAGRMQRMGAEFRCGVRVGTDVTMEDLHKQGFGAVFLGVGASRPKSMRCEGEDAGYEGFMHGIHFLREVAEGKRPLKGTRMCVVGGGNVAMDCVRTALRVGFTDVHLLYRRTEAEMPADQVEIDEAKEEGVHFSLLVQPVKILADDRNKVTGLECIKTELDQPDESGRRRPVPVTGHNFVIECDAILSAIGQRCDVSAAIDDQSVTITRWGTLMVNELTGQSPNRPSLFSGGDCVTGAATVIAALAAGKRAAHFIGKYLGGEDCQPDADTYLEALLGKLHNHGKTAKPVVPDQRQRHYAHMRDPQERSKGFDEVEGVLTPSQAQREASRCLRCYRLVLVAH